MALDAPSAHNSQPWKFFLTDNILTIFLENSRRLPVSDPKDRQSLISIGCVTKAISLAADYHGYSSEIEYSTVASKNSWIARIAMLEKTGAGNTLPKDHLATLLSQRTTNRFPYLKKEIPVSFIEQIQSLSTEHITLEIVTNEANILKIAQTALDAMIAMMDRSDFRHELSQYVKSNISKSKIGIPAYGMGISTVLSLAVPFLVRNLNMAKLSKRKDWDLLAKRTPAYLVIATKSDDAFPWIKVGELYLHVALLASRHGLSNAPWTAPIEIDSFRKELQDTVNSAFYPQLLARVGFSSRNARRSPRLSLREVLQIVEN